MFASSISRFLLMGCRTSSNAADASYASTKFVPESSGIDPEKFATFQSYFASIDKLVVLTGAGISTESGIPDYRSKLEGRDKEHRPITHQEFMSSITWRQRYWARNFLAWPRFIAAECNVTHRTLANWERNDPCRRFLWLVTQNVDGLHTKAGSRLVSELHGCGHTVICMDCKRQYSRSLVQSWMEELNTDWASGAVGELRPDGDVEVAEEVLHSFVIPHCPSCGKGSILKTNVVFFGDNVPLEPVQHCYEMINQCSGLLVLGSSLAVMSGFRFVVQANLLQLPILIVNIGQTRADSIATVKLEAKCSEIITRLRWTQNA